jgi:hypothetical protein
MQTAFVKAPDGTARELAIVGQKGETVFLCAIQRFQAARDPSDLEQYAVGFPLRDVIFADDKGKSPGR